MSSNSAVMGRAPRRRTAIFVAAGAMAAGLIAAIVVSQPSRNRPIASAYQAPAPIRVPTPSYTPSLPPLPELPQWERRLPTDLPPRGVVSVDRRGEQLTQPQFSSQPLSDAIFAGTWMLQADFAMSDLDGADFRGAELSQVDFGGADLSRAKFDGARLSQTHFMSADGATTGRTRVRNGIVESIPPDFIKAKGLGSASFREARFSQTSLEGLDLAGADFTDADLSSTNFQNADLRRASLHGARLSFSDFEGAKLDGADLRGADLSSARNLTQAQLNSARTDDTTRRPRRW